MQVRTFNSGNFSITVTSELKKIVDSIDLLEKHFPNVTKEYTEKNIAPLLINKIQRLILSGGSDIHRFSWGYWQKSGGDYNYVKGKARYFSGKFTGKKNWGKTNSRLLRFPIHPKSYRLRKVRKMPKAGQYALYDTGELYNSFAVLYSFKDRSGSETAVGSTSPKLDYHEVPTGNNPQRQVIAPIADWFQSKTTLHEQIMTKICRELQKRMRLE